MRITASASASALTMRGSSASSGSEFDTRAIASRVSIAATSRSTSSSNSSVTRLRPKLDCDEMALHARHPAGGALDHRGQLAVDRLGRGAVEGGGDGDHRPVDVGQLAHLDAAERGEPGEHDQRVEHEGEDRPAHEERDAPAAGGEARNSGSGTGSGLRARRRPRPGPARRPRSTTGAPGRRRCRPSVITRSPAASSPATSTLSLLRCTMRTGTRAARPSRPTQTKAPSAPHWIASGSTAGKRLAAEGELDREGHAAAQPVVGVVERGLHAQGAAGAVDAAVERDDLALERQLGAGERGGVDRVADREPAGEALRHPEVDQDARAVVDGGELGRRSSTWVPGSTGRMPTMPPIGATMVRRSSASAASRASSCGGPRAEPRLAQRHVGGRRRSRCSCSMRASVASASATASSARASAIASASSSSRAITSPGAHVRARAHLERDAAARRRAASPRPSGSPGRRRSPRPGRRPPTAPPRRRCTVIGRPARRRRRRASASGRGALGGRQPDAGRGAAPPPAGTPPTPRPPPITSASATSACFRQRQDAHLHAGPPARPPPDIRPKRQKGGLSVAARRPVAITLSSSRGPRRSL